MSRSGFGLYSDSGHSRSENDRSDASSVRSTTSAKRHKIDSPPSNSTESHGNRLDNRMNLNIADDLVDVEKLARATAVVRFVLSRSTQKELDGFERGRSRLRHFYSPFAARPLGRCSSTCLFQQNVVRGYAPGKRMVLMNKFRSSLLENRWIEVCRAAREFLKFSYNNANTGIQTLCYSIMKPLLLSFCYPISDHSFDKLRQIFVLLSNLPRSYPKRLQLELAHLLMAADSAPTNEIPNVLRQPLRTGVGFFRVKDQKSQDEIFAFDQVLMHCVPRSGQTNSGNASKILESSDHWVAAPLAWDEEDNQELKAIWLAICEPSSVGIERCSAIAPPSCRLRYALSFANVLANKEILNDNRQSDPDGAAYIDAQCSDLLWFSPSDDLLIFYCETNKLSETRTLFMLFRMLDSPKLARRPKLWRRLLSAVTQSEDSVVLEEARQNWVYNRDYWWPHFVEELGLQKTALSLAQQALSVLENL